MCVFIFNIYLFLYTGSSLWLPDQGLNPGSLYWECWVLATEPSRKTPVLFLNLASLKSSLSQCLVVQSCPTLCDLMDFSLPDLPVHEISQARLLEWTAISFSRGSSPPRDQTSVSGIGRWSLYHWATWEVPPWVKATYYIYILHLIKGGALIP